MYFPTPQDTLQWVHDDEQLFAVRSVTLLLSSRGLSDLSQVVNCVQTNAPDT